MWLMIPALLRYVVTDVAWLWIIGAWDPLVQFRWYVIPDVSLGKLDIMIVIIMMDIACFLIVNVCLTLPDDDSASSRARFGVKRIIPSQSGKRKGYEPASIMMVHFMFCPGECKHIGWTNLLRMNGESNHDLYRFGKSDSFSRCLLYQPLLYQP